MRKMGSTGREATHRVWSTDGVENPMKRIVFTAHGLGVPPVGVSDIDPAMWIDERLYRHVLATLNDTVELTFDDGYACCHEIGLPLLLEAGLGAKFFLSVRLLGKAGYLSPTQVCELRDAGMGIGVHGMTHRPWRGLGAVDLAEETAGARARLEDLLQQPVCEAACPFGAYDRRTLAALRWGGFTRVYTSDRLPARLDDWLVPRYTLRSYDTERDIMQVVERERKSLHLVKAGKRLLKTWI